MRRAELTASRGRAALAPVRLDHRDYVRGLKPIFPSAERRRNATAAVNPQEETQLRTLTAELAWPARCTMPASAV